MPWWCSKRYRR